MMMKQDRVYGYLRVSGKSQVRGDGFARQEQAIREYAELHGIEIVRIFKEEGVSGTKAARPALAKLMVALERNGHGVKTILIEKVDRLARDLLVQETIIGDLKKNGYELMSAHEGDKLLSDDPTRKLIRQVMGAIAEYEKAMLVEKMRAAKDRIRTAQGKCEGQKSYRESNPDLIKAIRRLRWKRKGVRRKTYDQVALELNERGFAQKNGKPLTGNSVRGIVHRDKKRNVVRRRGA